MFYSKGSEWGQNGNGVRMTRWGTFKQSWIALPYKLTAALSTLLTLDLLILARRKSFMVLKTCV